MSGYNFIGIGLKSQLKTVMLLRIIRKKTFGALTPKIPVLITIIMIGFTILSRQFQAVAQVVLLLLQVLHQAVLHLRVHLLHQVPALTNCIRYGRKDGDLVQHVIPIEKGIADIATGKVAHT